MVNNDGSTQMTQEEIIEMWHLHCRVQDLTKKLAKVISVLELAKEVGERHKFSDCGNYNNNDAIDLYEQSNALLKRIK